MSMSQAADKWFRLFGNDTRLLEPIRVLNEQRHNWTVIGLGIEGTPLTSQAKVTEDPKGLYDCTASDAHKRIAELAQHDTVASVQEKANSRAYLAKTALEDWKTRRETDSRRKIGAGVQRFLCTVGDFLTSFSGITEMIKAADQQFGGLAYGTVILLATVAVVKQKREDTIETTLKELSHAFPRLSTLRELQPGYQLEELIVTVFELSIVFCRETISYFTKSSRILAPLKTSGTRMETVSKLRLKLLEIRKECDILMLQKLEDVRLQLQDVHLQLGEANTRLEVIRSTSSSIEATGRDTNIRVQENQMRLRQDADRRAKSRFLLELQGQLKITTLKEQHVTTVATRVKKILADESSPRRIKGRGVPQYMSKEMLMQNDTFWAWFESKESSMLILAGCNFGDPTSIQLNWLSAASVWAAENMRGTNHVLAVFCQTSYTVTERTRRTCPSIVKSLIYQLAEHHPTGLDSQQNLIREALASESRDDEDHILELLFTLMQRFPTDESIVLILDRLDQCRWPDEHDDETTPLHQLVASLLHMMRARDSPRSLLRILLVMDEQPAKEFPKMFRWAMHEGLLSCKVYWTQELDEN